MIFPPNNPTWHGIPYFEWQGHNWICRPFWGIIHEQEPLEWADQEQPVIEEDGSLLLPFKIKKFQDHPIARSIVRTVEEFKYGTFEWEVILPEGICVWPALWLSSDSGWPPEIDALEGWSGDRQDYVKRLLFKNVKPTMHWSEGADERTGEHKFESKHNIFRFLIKGHGKVDRIKCVWTPSHVTVYYNGIRVKRFTDKEMLEHMNKPGYRMHAKMSVGVYGDEWMRLLNPPARIPEVKRHFKVLSFKYSPAI